MSARYDCAISAALQLKSQRGGVTGASLAGAAHATDESDRWFKNGLAWYEHPCGMNAFAKYGKLDTPEVRHNYYTALQHPEECSKLFP